jgi:hypothetical protein
MYSNKTRSRKSSSHSSLAPRRSNANHTIKYLTSHQTMLYFGVYSEKSRLIASKCSPTLSPTPDCTLTPVESALTRMSRVTGLESALTNSLDLKSFRIRTYKKPGGEGGSTLQVAQTLLSVLRRAPPASRGDTRSRTANPNRISMPIISMPIFPTDYSLPTTRYPRPATRHSLSRTHSLLK